MIVSNGASSTYRFTFVLRQDKQEVRTTLDVYQVSTLADQSNLAYRFAQHINSLGRITLGGEDKNIVGDIFYETPSVSHQIGEFDVYISIENFGCSNLLKRA